MKNSIRQLVLVILVFCSIPSLAQEEKMIPINIQYHFPENMDSLLKKKLDDAMKQRFNEESAHFKLCLDGERYSHTFVLDLSKVKVVSKRGRNTAYWINGLGMTVVPVAAIAAGLSAPIMINCFPQNTIKSTLTTPESFSGTSKRIKIKLCTGALFTQDDKMRDKLAGKLAEKLYKELRKLDNADLYHVNTMTGGYQDPGKIINF